MAGPRARSVASSWLRSYSTGFPRSFRPVGVHGASGGAGSASGGSDALAQAWYARSLRGLPHGPTQHRRHFGIMDTVQSGLEKRQEAKMREKTGELFRAQIEYLANCEDYNMAAHIVALEDNAKSMGLTGWKSKLRSSKQQQELEDRFAHLEIARALRPAEVDNPKLLRRKEKLRIANSLGVSVSDVNAFLTAYEQSTVAHRVLRSRKLRGLPMPKSEEEFAKMARADSSGMRSRDVKHTMPRMRGKSSMFRR